MEKERQKGRRRKDGKGRENMRERDDRWGKDREEEHWKRYVG